MNGTTIQEGKASWQKIVAMYAKPDPTRSIWQTVSTPIPFFILFYFFSVQNGFCTVKKKPY